MIKVLPIDSTPDARVFVDLDGVTFGLRTYWNARNQSWHLDISDAEGNDLVAGKRIGTTTWLNRNVKEIAGTILAVSTDALDDSDPGETELGVRVILLYSEAGDG